MKELIVFTGLQASGKSTFFDLHFKATHVHINLDVIKSRKKETRLLEEAFLKNLSIVIDNTNPTIEARKLYIELAKKHGYKVVAYYFDMSIDLCKKQNSERDRVVPMVAIYVTRKKLVIPSLSEGFDKVHIITQANFLTENLN